MIDYHTYSQIRDLSLQHHLSVAQIARQLHLSFPTVAKWVEKERFEPRKPQTVDLLLAPYHQTIRRLLKVMKSIPPCKSAA